MNKRGNKGGWGFFFMGVGAGVILSSIIPSGVVIFIMALMLLILGLCLMRR